MGYNTVKTTDCAVCHRDKEAQQREKPDFDVEHRLDKLQGTRLALRVHALYIC